MPENKTHDKLPNIHDKNLILKKYLRWINL